MFHHNFFSLDLFYYLQQINIFSILIINAFSMTTIEFSIYKNKNLVSMGISMEIYGIHSFLLKIVPPYDWHQP